MIRVIKETKGVKGDKGGKVTRVIRVIRMIRVRMVINICICMNMMGCESGTDVNGYANIPGFRA